MLSTVIPVYNEEESLVALHAEIDEVAQANGYDLDIVFIDDGSSDRSWEIIQKLAAEDDRVQGIRFRRNFGKAAALNAGFKAARGETIMTLDADLQDDPHEIPHFLAQLETGLDCISGWKQKRHDPWHKVLPSRVFNWMVSRLTGVHLHDHNCGMKCYRAEIFNEVRLYGERHRFVPVLAAARGFKVGERVVAHRARKFGQSKYGLERFIKGFLDLLTVKFLTGFGQRPQHILGGIGLMAFLVGGLTLCYLALRWSISRMVPGLEDYLLSGRPVVIYATGLLLLGGQFLSVGLIGELITALNQRDDATYSVSEQIGPGRQGDSTLDGPQATTT